MKKEILVLTFIVLLGGFLRFWRLSSRPVSLSIDEVAIAYNSYSILKTGRDEWGKVLPPSFRSVGDYKLPVLEYLMVPAMAVFGLTEFGTRFTVAAISSLTLIFVYLLMKEMTNHKTIALLTTFSLAISPWHIQYSRMTSEAIVALSLVIVGTWLFLNSLKEKGKFFWLVAFLFGLSLFTYHSERLFVPLFILGLGVIFQKKIFQKEKRKNLLLAILIWIIFFVPFIVFMFGPEGGTRATNVFISRDVEIRYYLHEAGEKLNLWQKIFDNNFLQIVNFWVKRYFEYFDFPYLFFNGMSLSIADAPGVGLFHLFELPFLILGAWEIFLKRKFLSREMFTLLSFWIALGPLAASLANNKLHPLRSLTLIPSIHLIVATGIFIFWEKVKVLASLKKLVLIIAGLLVVVISLIFYLDLYHFHYPINFSEYWSYGMKEAALYAWSHQKEYEKIVIDPSFGTQGPFTVSTPHLYVYFYGKYDPWLLQNDPLHGKGENKDSSDFLNFSFRPIYWPTDRFTKNTLFIGSPWSLPPDELLNAKLLQKIYFKNGAIALLIVSTKK